VESILNERNRGLAAALNQGLDWGEERGLAWILTFDQDTTPGLTLVAEAGRVFDAHRGRPVAVIGAGWIRRRDGGTDCEDPGGVEAAHVITSGALHYVPLWRTLGGFQEDFFIDYVDQEYCLRARSAGYVIARACVPTMSHAIGHPSRRWMLFRPVSLTNHSPVRRYYITRNRIRVWRAYWRREPAYVAYDMRAAIKELVKLLLFEDVRLGKLRAIAAGIRDAMRAEPLRP
jgi:rhamnosyltransferase